MSIRADSFPGRVVAALSRRGDLRVMAGMDIWRVYGGQPLPVTLATKRQARRLMRRYARLGIQSSLYSRPAGNHTDPLRARHDGKVIDPRDNNPEAKR